MQLREYQQDLLARTSAEFRARTRRVLMVLPTGGGKTVIFCEMVARAAARGKQVLILVHRAELLTQVSKTLTAFGIEHRLCSPLESRTDAKVIVASVFTAINRLDRLPPPDFVVVDEAHHAVGKTTWGRVLHWADKAHHVGVTATPARLSGEGLFECWDTMVQGPTTAELIEQGHLCNYRYFRPPAVLDMSRIRKLGGDYHIGDMEAALTKPQVTGDAVSHYEKHVAGKRAVAFCVTVEHADQVAQRFSLLGHRAEVLDGTMTQAERQRILAEFSSGTIKVLASCNIISEGFDLPAIECAILLRPTQSVSLYLQQVGRALRTFPGKEYAVILDHVGNVDRHGLPCVDREWTLAGGFKKTKEKTMCLLTNSVPIVLPQTHQRSEFAFIAALHLWAKRRRLRRLMAT
jgi:superfamily II DNA or RNA helicase